MKVQRDGRSFTVEVSADGEGMVSHAGAALLTQMAEKTGLTKALSRGLTGMRERRSPHDPGRVVADLTVMLADGGEALCDLRALRDQAPLFGKVASDSTAFRTIEKIAADPDLLQALTGARAKARDRAWSLGLAPERLTIDLDATLIGSHSEKEGAAGNFKGGFGFHPLLAYFDETSEAAAGMLRPGNAGANTAADQIAVAEAAIEQIPADRIEEIEVLLRADSAGASHDLLDWAREGQIGFSVGYEIHEGLRKAIEALPERAWRPALEADGSPRPNGEVAEVSALLDLSAWPQGSRVIVRRERAHPGAQLRFTDADGHRFQAILTDQDADDIAQLECRHRARARAEDQIRADKDTGLARLPFREFALNAVWLELIGIAHDLIAWAQALALAGELAKCEPKRLRYRLLHTAARLAFSGRGAKLRLQASWPWASELAAAFARLKALPAPAG